MLVSRAHYTFPASCWDHPEAQERGFHIEMVYMCQCLSGCYFAKFSVAYVWFSSKMKEPELQKLGEVWKNYGKKHPIWAELGAFLSKMIYWWVGNCAKNWCREIFKKNEIRQAYPVLLNQSYSRLVKVYNLSIKTFTKLQKSTFCDICMERSKHHEGTWVGYFVRMFQQTALVIVLHWRHFIICRCNAKS